MDALSLSIAELASAVQAGTISAEEVTGQSLQRARETEGLGAFVHLSEQAALTAARDIDRRQKLGETLGPLAGVPIGIKDALCTVDAPTTAASRILTSDGAANAHAGYRPAYDATVVERLRRADAVLVGKLNMDEFAMGSSNENSAFGPCLNPWDPTRIPGGSSGGSAVSVASGAVLGSLGSDTGGSVRQPAGLCGVVGVKPSYGRVSRYGLMACASSLDQVGPLARDVRGTARMLQVIAGPDAQDSTCTTQPVDNYETACTQSLQGLKVGIPKQYFGEGLDPEVGEATQRAIADFEKLGCTLVPVDLPHTRYGVSTYYLLMSAEVSSNLSRYDGVRFGLRAEAEGNDIHGMYAATRGRGFGPEVKRRIMLGTYALSAGYYEAYYAKAQKVRTLIRRDFAEALDKVDFLAGPLSPTPAFKLGEKSNNPLQMYLGDIYTLPASLAGVCGISIPIGTTRASDARPPLPLALQLFANLGREDMMFRAAFQWEQAHPEVQLRPPALANTAR